MKKYIVFAVIFTLIGNTAFSAMVATVAKKQAVPVAAKQSQPKRFVYTSQSQSFKDKQASVQKLSQQKALGSTKVTTQASMPKSAGISVAKAPVKSVASVNQVRSVSVPKAVTVAPKPAISSVAPVKAEVTAPATQASPVVAPKPTSPVRSQQGNLSIPNNAVATNNVVTPTNVAASSDNSALIQFIPPLANSTPVSSQSPMVNTSSNTTLNPTQTKTVSSGIAHPVAGSVVQDSSQLNMSEQNSQKQISGSPMSISSPFISKDDVFKSQ